MGEAAEMILNGLLCQECAAFIDGNEPGYPRTCEGCARRAKEKPEPRTRRRSGPYRRRG